MDTKYPWVIAISGSSGTVYARRLVKALVSHIPDIKLEVILSPNAARVMREEEGISVSISNPSAQKIFGVDAGDHIRFHRYEDIGARVASGSFKTSGMLVVPCSMASLAGVSSGLASNLILRAADVTIKEGRRLIMLPREMPLSSIHIENMLTLSKAGVVICPGMPGFYQKPQSINDLVDHVVQKLIDLMGFDVDLVGRWTPESEQVKVLDIVKPKQGN